MILNSMGMSVRHGSDFIIDRPKGLGDYLFIVFKTDALVNVRGEWISAGPDECLLFSKDHKQLYKGKGKIYINHYIHFEPALGEKLDTGLIPLNEPFYVKNVTEIENMMRLIAREQISQYETAKENTDYLIRLLINKLKENSRLEFSEPVDKKHLDELVVLRSDIYSNAGKYKSVTQMARIVSLSLSHFQALYSKNFNVSAYEDLTNAKIEAAKNLLKDTELSVREIGAMCGYTSDTAFVRCFKKNTGNTPLGYAREKGFKYYKDKSM